MRRGRCAPLTPAGSRRDSVAPVTTPDPVDIRLLAMLADAGKVAVHELAGRLGMDPREAATRLINLSASGLPLVVGAECDPGKLRGYLAAMQAQQQAGPAAPMPQGRPPAGQAAAAPPPPAGWNVPGPPGPNPAHPGQVPPGGPADVDSPHAPAGRPPAPSAQQPALGMWGLPQSSAWARGDEQAGQKAGDGAGEGTRPRTGRVGEQLYTTGLEGDPISIRLVEVVDPADSLYTAAGYTVGETERPIVVHTELTNHGSRTYNALPDQYLVLYTADGNAIGKAPISLASRPPHTLGVPAGETVGGHAVYVLSRRTRVLEVRWLARPDSLQNSLTWQL